MARLRTKAVDLKPSEHYGAARRIASRLLPYISKGLFRMRERQIVGFAPAGAYPIAMTAGGVMLWDPKWWLARKPAMFACAVLHELGHWLRNHSGRRGDRDPRGWNEAGDAEINDDLRPVFERYFKDDPEIMKFINTWIYPATFGCDNGKIAEYYYAQRQKQQQPQAGTSEEEGEQNEGEDEDGPPSPGHGNAQPRKPCCGGASGNKHPDEGTIDEEMGQTPYAAEAIRRAVAADIKAHHSSKPGSTAAGWERWADGVLQPPKVRWQDTMGRTIRRSCTVRRGNTFSSYEMISRRQGVFGITPGSIIVPARVTPIFNLVIAIDTSGSMSNELLIRCVSEVKAILAQVRAARVTFCTVDVDVYNMHTVRTISDVLRDRLPGGGGTVFNSLFEVLTTQRKKFPCDLLTVLTDGYAMVPATPPPFPVLWGLVGGNDKPPTSWGTPIVIDLPEAEAA